MKTTWEEFDNFEFGNGTICQLAFHYIGFGSLCDLFSDPERYVLYVFVDEKYATIICKKEKHYYLQMARAVGENRDEWLLAIEFIGEKLLNVAFYGRTWCCKCPLSSR